MFLWPEGGCPAAPGSPTSAYRVDDRPAEAPAPMVPWQNRMWCFQWPREEIRLVLRTLMSQTKQVVLFCMPMYTLLTLLQVHLVFPELSRKKGQRRIICKIPSEMEEIRLQTSNGQFLDRCSDRHLLVPVTCASCAKEFQLLD